MKKLILGLVLAVSAQMAFGQSAIIRGEESAGVYQNLKSTSGVLQTIINSAPTNATTNVTQFGSNNVATGTGVSGVGVPRVTVSSDSNVLATQSGTWTVLPGNTPNTSAWLMQFPVTAGVALDPCLNPSIAKSSAVINITTATTTNLVALSGSTIIYGCSFNLTISQVVTTANTIKFVYGTGGTCGTGTTDLTGAFGAGGVTAAAPIVVNSGYGGTIFKTAAGNGLCATTAIGASAFFTGVLTYVQL